MVEQLKEAARRTQHTLRSHEESTLLLQQKFVLMERTLGQLESTAEGLRGKLTEVHRVVGEMVMQQRNTDLLIQQMERQHQQLLTQQPAYPAPPPPSPPAAQGEKAKEAEVAAKVEDVHVVDTAVFASPELPAATLAGKVAELEARIHQLTLELFGADRLSCAIANARGDARSSSHATAGALAAALTSSDATETRRALMWELQQRHAVSIFTDTAGVTRVASQCVRLHNIPLNLGAAAVREVCVQHVCGGKSAGLVSCMVWRSPDGVFGNAPTVTTTTTSSTGEKQRGTGASVYHSKQQQQQQQQDTRLSEKKGVEEGAARAAAAVGSLPQGGAVAAIQPNTKTFEVVFATSTLAVQALTVLNGLQLRPTMHAEPTPLVAEPVVSAEVVAAMRALYNECRNAENK